MTITNAGTDNLGSQGPNKPFKPALTQKEAAQLGYSKVEFGEAEQYVRMITEDHQRLGTPRDQWEPQPIQGEHLAAAFIEDGEQELAGRLETDVDPRLDEMQECLSDVKANLDELDEKREPIITPESGTAHSTKEATALVGKHDAKIEQDEAESKHHHRRAPYWLKKIAPWAPWLELAGFLFFVAYFLNVPLLKPWVDFGAWTLSLAIVVSTILGQTWLVHHAAKDHNHGREAFAEGNRHEGEQAFRRRNWFLIGSMCTATTAITIGLVLRGTTALGDAGLGTILFMIFVAIIAGFIMPAMAYLAIALDGSKVSRERDSLAKDLDEDLEAHSATIDESRRGLAAVDDNRDTLNKKVLPDICQGVQEIVDGAYRPYGLVRLIIGGLTREPLTKAAPRITYEGDRAVGGFIGTSIPGAHSVNLRPLFDRGARLNDLELRRRELLTQLNAVPAHPWGTSRTT
jgi:hypothetical protein